MSDFLTSLVARSLGEAAPAQDVDIRPRPVAAFEPEGSPPAVEPDTAIDVTEQVYETRPGSPRLPFRDAAPDAKPAAQRPPAAELPTAAEQPLHPAPPMAQRAPAETPPAQTAPRDQTAPADAPPATATPAPDAAPLRPAKATEPRNTSRPSAPDVYSDVRTEQRDAPADETPAPRGERSSPEIDAEQSAQRQPRDLPALERIIRQMVFAPRPDPVTALSSEAPGEPWAQPVRAPSPHRRNHVATDPVGGTLTPQSAAIAEPDEPVMRVNPPRGAADNPLAAKLKPVLEGRDIQLLSPVPQPPRLPEQPPEATVRISIGRIEVRTGAETAPDSAPRPKRPEAPLMSLDDYLTQRAKES